MKKTVVHQRRSKGAKKGWKKRNAVPYLHADERDKCELCGQSITLCKC